MIAFQDLPHSFIAGSSFVLVGDLGKFVSNCRARYEFILAIGHVYC
jgi:hypothetical protein